MIKQLKSELCTGSGMQVSANEHGDLECPVCGYRAIDEPEPGEEGMMPKHRPMGGIWDAIAASVSCRAKRDVRDDPMGYLADAVATHLERLAEQKEGAGAKALREAADRGFLRNMLKASLELGGGELEIPEDPDRARRLLHSLKALLPPRQVGHGLEPWEVAGLDLVRKFEEEGWVRERSDD